VSTTTDLTVPQPQLTLYTIAMSHFSEKIRWLLDVERLPYREVALTPMFHVLPALRMGGRARTTVPVLSDGKRTVQDSTRIIHWLLRERGSLSTLPPELQEEIMALEDTFDAIGDSVVRYLYYTGFSHRDIIIDLWTRFATPGQSRFIRAAYEPIKAVFKLKLWIYGHAAKRAEQRLDAAVSALEARLAGGKRYLVGDRFTVADITAAALLAPLACPPEHALYGAPSFREKLIVNTALWNERPGLTWVREMYARHRGPFWATLPRAA
jgi:glutathione S-transferase